MRPLRLIDAIEHRGDLVGRFVLVAADLELDERRAPALGDLAAVRGVERRPHVLDDVQRGNAGDDVLDRSLECRVARPERLALDQDALAGGLLEAGLENPVHATGLTRSRRVRIDGLGTDRATDRKCDDDERKPSKRGRLPVAGAPAAHARRQVEMGLTVGGHSGSSLA